MKKLNFKELLTNLNDAALKNTLLNIVKSPDSDEDLTDAESCALLSCLFENDKKDDLIEKAIEALCKKDSFTVQILKILKKNKILTTENFQIVFSNDKAEKVLEALEVLKEADIKVTQEFFLCIGKNKNPYETAETIAILYSNNHSNLLTDDNFKIIALHGRVENLNRFLYRFLVVHSEKVIINDEDFKGIAAKSKSSNWLVSITDKLHLFSLLNQNYFDLIKTLPENQLEALYKYAVSHKSDPSLIKNLFSASVFLKDHDLLSEENFQIIHDHKNPISRAEALKICKENDLGDKFLHILTAANDPASIARAMAALSRAGVPLDDTTVDIMTKLMQLENPTLVRSIEAIVDNNHDVLNAEIIRQILHYNDIFSHATVFANISALHRGGMTRGVLTQIITLCAAANGNKDNAVLTIRDYLATIVPPAAAVVNAQLNPTQSTHTLSVHKSVSKSAKKLMQQYGDRIQGAALSAVIEEIVQWVTSLPVPESPEISDKNLTAKNALATLPYESTDPESQITFAQLLALSWLAMHDGNNLIGFPMEPKQQQEYFACNREKLRDALYEIKRGGNLNDAGEDDGKESEQICPPGAFNKAMQILDQVSVFVEIVYMNFHSALLKLRALTKIKLHERLTSPESAADVENFLSVIKDIATNGITRFWNEKPTDGSPSLKETIENEIYEEFKELFLPSGKNNGAFKMLMEQMEEQEESKNFDLSSFKKVLRQSKGYKEFCTNALHQQGFFANADFSTIKRGFSTEQQHDFDLNWAIVPSPKGS